jgi:muramidase (phage lysozyme)
VWLLLAIAVAAYLIVDTDMFSTPSLGPREQDNLDAFLSLLGEGEGGPAGYASLVGSGAFADFTDHPAVLGTFAGIPLGGGLISTAAGRYQITRTTWLDLGGRARYGSFEPLAQDRAATDLIKRRGMWAAVIAGRIDQAAYGLRDEWQMFTQAKWAPALAQSRFETLGGMPS